MTSPAASPRSSTASSRERASYFTTSIVPFIVVGWIVQR